MFNTFDAVYLFLLAFFFYRGWSLGIFHALIGPACLAFWSIIGIMNYDLNENLLRSAIITISGGVISAFVINTLFFLGKRSVNRQHRHYVFGLSRVAGAVLNTIWNGLICACAAILLTLMPTDTPGLKSWQENITQSRSYIRFEQRLIRPLPVVRNIRTTISVLTRQDALEAYAQTPEYQAVFKDPQIRALTENPEIMNRFYNNDAMALLADPQVQAILENPDIMQKISALGQRIFKDSPAAIDRSYLPTQNSEKI